MKVCNHTCYCGGANTPHETGSSGCFREMTTSPVLIEDNGNVQVNIYTIDGHNISGFTLTQQRLYYEHPCGCWSRSKDGSCNSLPDET